MSLAEGINLGLQLSRGSRDEVRRDEMLAQQKEQIRRQNEYQDKIQPIQLEALQQDLASAKSNQAYLENIRPIERQRLEAGLAQIQAQTTQEAELHPVRVSAEKARQNAYQQSADQEKVVFQQAQEDRELAAKKQWVADQAAIEWNNVARGGDFSDKFLQRSAEIGSPVSPERLMDGKYVNALDTMHNILDPKRPESAADKGQLMSSLNVLFNERLHMPGTAPNGSPIKSREITDIHPVVENGKPVRGKFYVNLRVTPESGEPYDAPLTTSGSADPKAPVKAVDLGDVVNMVRSQSYFSNVLKSSPELQSRLASQLKTMTKGKVDEVEWQGGRRKLSDLREIYKEDNSLKGVDGETLVSFADYEWTGGDSAKLEHARMMGYKNQALMEKIKKARADGDEQLEAQLQSQWVDVQGSWKYAEERVPKAKADAAAAEAKLGAKDVAASGLADYKVKNPKWYLEELTPELSRTLTKEQWKERAAHLAKLNTEKQQQQESDSKEQQGLALADGQRRLAAHQANTYIDTQFAALPLQAKKSWYQQNEHLLSDDQKFKATNLINADVYGSR